MKNYSIWKDNIKLPNYKKLNNNIEVDVLIIGGGMSGINTLYQLKDTNLKTILLEQNKIGMGVTANTTGNIDAEKYNRNFEKLCEAITKIEEEVLLPEEIMQ